MADTKKKLSIKRIITLIALVIWLFTIAFPAYMFVDEIRWKNHCIAMATEENLTVEHRLTEEELEAMHSDLADSDVNTSDPNVRAAWLKDIQSQRDSLIRSKNILIGILAGMFLYAVAGIAMLFPRSIGDWKRLYSMSC